jgi:hypothetical protein
VVYVEFSPHRERSRHDAIVERARRATLGRPFWLLCPRVPLADALEASVARAGGGFLRVLDWDRLARQLEDALDLPTRPVAPDTARAVMVEGVLAVRAARAPALAAAMRVDPFGVALAALRVLDELRLAGWTGDPAVVARARDVDDAAALVASHLDLLAELLRGLERGLAEAGMLDLPARLARVLAAPTREPLLPCELLTVEGVDRLAPLERAVLERVQQAGTRVDVAPWVDGWRGPASRPLDLATRPRTGLEAYARAPEPVTAPGDDDSVLEVAARDPDDEAEGVARWLAEQDPAVRDEVAVLVPGEPGYAPRVARALARHGLLASYSSTEPVHRAPLWQVVRASVRLGWRGADAIDLATALTAPGSGIWGADRDRLCARLRERVPTSWEAVRDELARATDPRYAEIQGGEEGEANGCAIDPQRARDLEQGRARVEELLAMWERAGPLARRSGPERLAALRELVHATLARFANPVRFREAFADPRVAAAWTSAARAIGDAADTVLESMARSGLVARQNDPAVFLAPLERLLGSAPDALRGRRDDTVRILVDTPFSLRRPATLVVLGFQRGRYPATPGTPLLLGPLEREALARAADLVPGLAEIADEGARAALLERDARRALSLPTARLVLVTPRRDARGEATEASLARWDLLAAYPADVAEARARRGPMPMHVWVRATAPTPRSPRAALFELVERAAGGDAVGARAVLPTARGATDVRDFLASRARPDRAFVLGDLVREKLAAEAYSMRALEMLLKCRYGFLLGSVLHLRDLRLARAPVLSLGDHAAIAHGALRVLDASAGSEGGIDAAVDAAVGSRVRGDRSDQTLEAEEIRRTVRGFVERYAAVREAWGTTGGAVLAPPERADGERVTTKIALATSDPRAPREIAVVGEPARVETVASPEGRRAVVVELRTGGVDKLAKQREAGLGVASALLPVLAEKQHGVPVVAVAQLSLGKPEADVLASERAPAFGSQAGVTAVRVDATHSLESARDGVLARIAAELDAVAGGGEMPPHSREQRARLKAARATSCEFCVGRLACRFDMEEP